MLFLTCLLICLSLSTIRLTEAVVLHVRPSARVVLGMTTDPYTIPFYCTLYSEYEDDSGTSVCGCVLLESDKALTAAHCVTKHDGTKLLRARALFVRLYGDMRPADGELVRLDASSVRVAPDYRHHDLHDDVAVVTVPHTPVVVGVSGVRVNDVRRRWDELTNWDKIHVVGVGFDRHDELSLGVPRVAALSRRSCANPVGFGNLLPWTSEVYHDDICAGPFSPCDADYRCADSCRGDSGGPLYKKENNGTVTIYGIVSRGSNICGVTGAFDGRPGIYAATDQYIEFIEDDSLSYLVLTSGTNFASPFLLGSLAASFSVFVFAA